MILKEQLIIENERDILAQEKPIIPPITDQDSFDFSFKVNRDRFEQAPDRLPTFGMKPFPTDEHIHIGMYETKQNLYLTTAMCYNNTQDRIDELTSIINILTDRILKLEQNNVPIIEVPISKDTGGISDA